MSQPRPYNFSAGPATMPVEVLSEAAQEMLDWQGSGMGVMEMSHRGREFTTINEQALQDLRELLQVPEHFKILWMQGGGIAQNAIVPLNLSCGDSANFVVTGSWSQKSYQEAAKYCRPVLSAQRNPDDLEWANPGTWHLSDTAAYTHICSNETIDGVEFQELPDLLALGHESPLVIDCSSHIGSRSINWNLVGCAFAGAQKNIGPAGLTVVIIREDLLGRALATCPSAFNYSTVAKANSMFNTPPTYSIYMAGKVFEWMKRQGGVAALEQAAIAKSQLLYNFIDQSEIFYNPIDLAWRSRMNVPFFIHERAGGQERCNEFVYLAKSAGLLQLKGHSSVGGLRASIYNAMPLEGVQALVEFMRHFEARS